ncbi:MAG: proton-conducting transporter membrane subunit [Planctomyces sp.]
MIQELHFPWLEVGIILPLLGGGICACLTDSVRAQKVAIFVAGLTLLLAVGEWVDFSMVGSFEAHDHWDLTQRLTGRDNILVIDELSAPLPALSSLLFLLTILSTLRTKLDRFSMSLTLFSESIVLATLSCHDPWLLIVLLSLAVLPPWIELVRRGVSPRVFLIHMGAFIVLLVAGRLLLGDAATGGQASGLSATLLTVAALLRAGVVPVHCWMADLLEKATFGTAILFLTPMTGAFAVMHLVLPVVPVWAIRSIAILSLITAGYSAGMALVQKDARRFFCYLFLSHSSLVLSGLELVNVIGMTGALCVWISVGLSLTGFGLTIRAVESRIGRISLDRFHGMYEHTPTLAGLFLLTGLASIGFPGTIGFVGMELLIEGCVEVYPLVGLSLVLASALNGISILRAWFRIFTGVPLQSSVSLKSQFAERFAVVLLALLILGGGLWPQPGVASRHHAAKSLMDLRHQRATVAGSQAVETMATGRSASEASHP